MKTHGRLKKQGCVCIDRASPTNSRRRPNAGLMLGQRRRRWANIILALGRHFVFAVNVGSQTVTHVRAGALVQWLKLPAWKVGDRGFNPHSGIQVSKQNVLSPLTRED